MSSNSTSTTTSSTTATDELHDAYSLQLRAALDAASSAFFAQHTQLTPDAQRSIIANWCAHEHRDAYRPSIASTTAVANGSTGTTTLNGVPVTGRKKVRGYIDGCYDIMHSGHFNAIRQAKSLCDELVVGVHSNAEIEHHKGPPVMSDDERLAAVKACKWVDQVVFGVPYVPSVKILDELNCDFCVHGDDEATDANGHDVFAEAKAAGRMATVKRTEGVSTTDLVNRLLAMTKNHHAPAQGQSLASHSPLRTASEATLSPTPLTLSPPAPVPSSTSTSGTSSSTTSASTGTSTVSSFLPTTWRLSQFANHRVPRANDRIVYIAGSWDLFHSGHIERLEQAKKMGDFVYVGVYDDAAVNRYKGSNFPIMNLHERVLNVLSCKFVDEVVIGAPFTITKDLITTLNIHVVAQVLPCESSLKRKLPNGQPINDPCAIVAPMGIVKQIPATSSLHTDVVIQRILDNRIRYEKRNASRAVKEQKYAAQKTYVQEQ